MGIIYDNWERLIVATLKREQLRELARADSRDPSFSSISSDFNSTISLSSPVQDQSLLNPGFDAGASSGPSTSFYRGSIVEGPRIPRSADGILQFPSAKPILFKELNNATRNFRPDAIIGEGAFGRIFKGWINEHTFTAAKPGSGMPIAVKVWSPRSSHGFSEWLATANYLNRLRHPNLIRLIAYCHEGNNMLLVYEFMQRGSLDNYLSQREHECLCWATRIKVAVGAARALSFLHDVKNKVILRDFHSAHILLDEEFNVKLSGFGLAKDGPLDDKTHVSTRVVGTSSILAPEYVATGHLTEKCDVYGFGIVLLQLLSGGWNFYRSNGDIYALLDWEKLDLSKKKMDIIMDTKLEGKYNEKEAVIVANLALQCISHHPESRLTMAEVLATLEQL